MLAAHNLLQAWKYQINWSINLYGSHEFVYAFRGNWKMNLLKNFSRVQKDKEKKPTSFNLLQNKRCNLKYKRCLSASFHQPNVKWQSTVFELCPGSSCDTIRPSVFVHIGAIIHIGAGMFILVCMRVGMSVSVRGCIGSLYVFLYNIRV